MSSFEKQTGTLLQIDQDTPPQSWTDLHRQVKENGLDPKLIQTADNLKDGYEKLELLRTTREMLGEIALSATDFPSMSGELPLEPAVEVAKPEPSNANIPIPPESKTSEVKVGVNGAALAELVRQHLDQQGK